jgi:lysozyme family protein
MDDLDKSLEFLLEEEGGWSDHVADRGGKTMWGVTQGTYDGWRKSKGLQIQSVKNITKAEVRRIYEDLYWKAAGCDRLPWPINYLTFDAAVNSGPSRAVRWTQTGLGIPADGQVGPKTESVAKAVVDQGDGKAILRIVDQRVQFLSRLVQKQPDQAAFLLGWWRRTVRVLARALLSE